MKTCLNKIGWDRACAAGAATHVATDVGCTRGGGRSDQFPPPCLLRTLIRLGAGLIAGVFLSPPLAALNPERRADSYTLQGWSTEQGLPSNKMRSLVQARDGYLWIATAQGIARFDGNHFTVFSGATDPTLRGGGFYAVKEAPDGTLWFGGDHGIFHWSNGRFERFTVENGLADNYVRALALTRRGEIVACTRAGYSFFRDGRLATPGGVWKQITGIARSYLEHSDGSILLGTEEGLWRIQGEKIELLSGPGGIPGSAFNSLLEGPDGSLWIGTSLGLRHVRPDGSWEHFGAAEGLANPRIASLRHDRDGNFWIGTYAGLYRLSHGVIEPASYPGQINGSPIQQMHEDQEGGWWLATSIGLFRLKDNICRNIGAPEGLSQTSVYSLFESADGMWWIGLWGGGVFRYDQIRATPLAVPPALGLDMVVSFAEYPTGTMWIGANSGLYQHRGDTTINLYDAAQAAAWQKEIKEHPTTFLPGIAHNHVNAITPDKEGGLWVATDGALYHGNAGHFRAHTTADGLPGNNIKSVLRTSKGEVWITAPPRGVARLHAGQWTTYECGKEISDITPRVVYEDGAGDIWVTTEGGGLNRFKDERWSSFTVREGLTDNFIAGIIEDTFGNFWISGPRGIMRIPRQQFDDFTDRKRQLLEPRVFSRSDGLPPSEVNQLGCPNSFRTEDGRLLFATSHGVAVVEPKYVKINRVVPPMRIERLLIDGTEADLTRPVVVPPGQNDIQIHYTAINLLSPEKVRFKIRLEPLDRDWEATGSRREVRYDKLPPGDYRFRVIASNDDGIWNDEGASLAFSVQPYFYQTSWFLGLSAAALIAGLLLIYRVRLHQSRRRLAELELLVNQRTHELQDIRIHLEKRVEERTAALKYAQEEAVLERARFKFIFESVPVGVSWMVIGRPETRMVNIAQAQITGVPREQCQRLDLYRAATHPEDRDRQTALHQRLLANEVNHYTVEKRYVHPDGKTVWATLTVRCFRDPLTGALQELSALADITDRKRAEAERENLHRQLLESSRQAGIAEFATGVLHNVGNVLNSVQVATSSVADSLKKSRAASLAKAVAMMREHEKHLGEFLTQDPKGKQLPAYLSQLADHLAKDQALVLNELADLQKSVEHIKDIVTTQQNVAKTGAAIEALRVQDLLEDAVKINASSLRQPDLVVLKEFENVPLVAAAKNKVLQILINLVRNAAQACDESSNRPKRVALRIRKGEHCARVEVNDNGIGISQENLARLFVHGFTTKKDGHGFGLHSAALAAKEVGGSLSAESEGPGRGATFILELPLAEAVEPHPEITPGGNG